MHQLDEKLPQRLLPLITNDLRALSFDLAYLQRRQSAKSLALFGNRDDFVPSTSRFHLDVQNTVSDKAFNGLLCGLPRETKLTVNIRESHCSPAKLAKYAHV